MMAADLREELGKRIIEAARMAAAMHLAESVEVARRQVVIGGAGRDRCTDASAVAGTQDASRGIGGTRSRFWSADGVGE